MATNKTYPTRGPARPLRTRAAALLAALSVIMMSGGLVLMTAPTASATQEKIHKSYVCKYVGTPGVDERLQTGQNPIYVDNHSIAGKDDVSVGDRFTDAQGSSVVIVANTEKLDPEPSVEDCPAPRVPSDKTVTPKYASATPPDCDTDGKLVVPTQDPGVVVTGGGANNAGPGTYTFKYEAADGYAFPANTEDEITVHVLAATGDCPAVKTPVTPLTPTATPPSCTAAGALVTPVQPVGVITAGGGVNGSGPGTYHFSFTPDATHTFPQGVSNPTNVSVTVLPTVTENCGGNPPVNPTLVTPNAPSQTPPTCTAAGTVVAPAAQTGVNVARTELGNGSVKFDSSPATGFVFSGAQTVSSTVTAPAKLTGAQCAEVEGTGVSTGEPPATVKTPTVKTPAVKGTSSGRTPTVAGVSNVRSTPVPNAVEAGLAGQQTDVRVLLGQALVGAGLLLFVASAWSGLGIRRRGVAQA